MCNQQEVCRNTAFNTTQYEVQHDRGYGYLAVTFDISSHCGLQTDYKLPPVALYFLRKLISQPHSLNNRPHRPQTYARPTENIKNLWRRVTMNMAAWNGNKLRYCCQMRLLLLVLCTVVVFGFVPCSKIQSNISLKTNSYDRIRAPFVRFARDDSNDEEEDDDDDDDIDLSDQDWRAFRAKLVMQKPEKPASEVIEDEGDLDGIGSVFSTSTSTTEQEQVKSSSPTLTPLDPSQWAYDSGNVIETGAVILGGVEQDYGFGLRQQYFHKAAILVLDHEESTFTKGIILNRPSDLTLDDDLNEGVKWRVWFGGDVQGEFRFVHSVLSFCRTHLDLHILFILGLESNMPEIVCLHSLKEKEAVDASIPVMKDIQVSIMPIAFCFI
jgi:hypothetical protein